MKKINRLKYIIAVMVALFVFAVSFNYTSGAGGKAYAASTAYSSVIDDLTSDPNFNFSDYAELKDNYSIKVIQIAESSSGELFLYTYQPCMPTRKLEATKVNMSLSESVEGTDLYGLTLVSTWGVFGKYRVDGLAVSSNAIRYYNITSIYRDWVRSIDTEAGNENTINGVAYAVGQKWKLNSASGTINYEMTEEEIINITAQMIGMRRYSDGFLFAGTKACDSHYIAFNCSHKIDNLLSADVKFNTTPYKSLKGSGTTYGDPTTHKVTLYDYQVANNDGSGWFGKKEEWHRMTSVKDFVQEVDLTESEQEMLSDYDWILNFYETEYTCEVGGKDILISALLPFGFIWTLINALTTTGEIVSEVSLLRLEFNCDGEIYNLGVVSNIQTGSNKPTNTVEKTEFDFWQYVCDCIVNLFKGTANSWEKFVAVSAIIIIVIVTALAIAFLKWIYRCIFK